MSRYESAGTWFDPVEVAKRRQGYRLSHLGLLLGSPVPESYSRGGYGVGYDPNGAEGYASRGAEFGVPVSIDIADSPSALILKLGRERDEARRERDAVEAERDEARTLLHRVSHLAGTTGYGEAYLEGARCLAYLERVGFKPAKP